MSEQYIDQKDKELYLPEGQPELLLTYESSKENDEVISNEENEINQEIPETRNKALEEARKVIEKESLNQEELSKEIEENESINSELDSDQTILSADNSKYLAKQQLLMAEKNLTKKDQFLSRIMNNSAVDKVSEGVGKTVARPSGFLGGAILAFSGSLVYLIFVKYVGINYNYLMFFGFFIAGFAVGILIELILRLKH